MDAIIKDLESRLPEVMTTSDLIDIGLWPNHAAALSARQRGRSPDFVKVG